MEKVVEVNGRSYKLLQLTTNKALSTLTLLTKLLGPSLAELLVADQDVEGSVERASANAFSIFCSTINDRDLETLRRVFGDVTFCLDGDKEQLLSYNVQDLHFQGRPMDVFLWLWEALRHNYADFFEGARPLFAKLAAPQASGSKSPKASNGGSGE